MNLPGRVPLLFDKSLLEYYQARLAQSTGDYYKGRKMAKMPEDLRVYQHIIEASRPEVIVELGSHHGASALWFADQLDVLCGGGRVITVDVNRVTIDDPRVTVLTGDLSNSDIVAAVHAFASGKRVLVSEDSAHVYESTRDALWRYSGLVTQGSWFVVEDTVVDDPRFNVWANGGRVMEAIDEFMAGDLGERFSRHDLNMYGVSSNTGGYLEAWR